MFILCIQNLAQVKYMNTISRIIIRKRIVFRSFCSNVRHEISKHEQGPNLQKPKLRFNNNNKRRTIGSFGWMLLMVPAVTFCLGSWQVRRKAWKEQLLSELRKRRDTQPITLHDLGGAGINWSTMEYYPVHVRGYYLHDLAMFLGPRTLLVRGDAATEGGLMSQSAGMNGGARQGYLLVTPFQLEGGKEMVLVNRGWIPASYVRGRAGAGGKDAAALRKEDTANVTEDLIGLIRLTEQRPLFMPQQQSNQQKDNIWMYRNIEQMALQVGADCCTHIFLDATDDHLKLPQLIQPTNGTSVQPIANQTRITLRNEHMSYVLTWYGLSAATAILWYRHFLIKR